MEAKQNLEVIQEAINQLLVEEENGNSVDRRNLLADLRSQLEQENCVSVQEAEVEEGSDEVMKELKNIKRQNSITHGLLSAIIVVTLACQLSEVSLILKIGHVLSSPLESLGGILKIFRSGQPKVDVQQVLKQASSSLKVPYLELPALVDTSEEE